VTSLPVKHAQWSDPLDPPQIISENRLYTTDSITCSITQTITDIANDTIPNIIISIRKDNPPWLTTAMKKQIRRKKRIHKRAKQTNLEGYWLTFRKARNICNKLILNGKTKYYSSISEKNHTETTGSKNW
jgi:hypothetical protein